MRWTGASERTVKNWLAGLAAPTANILLDLIRNSDEVLDAVLLIAARQQVAAANKLVDVRNKLAETIQQVDELMGEGGKSLGVTGQGKKGSRANSVVQRPFLTLGQAGVLYASSSTAGGRRSDSWVSAASCAPNMALR